MLASAKAQAKKALDEATARATAIHDGAERRLNLLSTRHAETIKRLTDILDGVSGLVAGEAARMSLEDEVDQATAKAIEAAAESNGAPRPAEAPARPATPGGPPGPRPAAPQPALRAQSSPGPSPSAPAPSAQAQEKPHAPARAAIIDSDEQAEGVRVVPVSDG